MLIVLPAPAAVPHPPATGHLLVLRSVARPTVCVTVPTVLDGHIDAAVDEELHRLVAPVEDQMVQDARWLMGVPPGVEIRAVREEEVRHVEVTVDDGKGECGVENL